MSFFGVGGNPFGSPIGQKIEVATSELLPSEDWTLYIEICDLISSTEEGPKDAIKAIRKRLNMQPKNYTMINYTLTILETCVKNCGKRFHVLACSKDFVQEMVKLIGPKNDPPCSIQDKVLALIQSWADTFRNEPDLSGVSQVYAELKHKGLEFPGKDNEAQAPIITPTRTVNPPPQKMHPTPASSSVNVSSSVRHEPLPSQLGPEQRAKLKTELDLVESNGRVLSEMLQELVHPSDGKDVSESDRTLIMDLHATCIAMQQRIVALIPRLSDDSITKDLLRINDDLNNIFLRFDRHMGKKTPSPISKPAAVTPVKITTPEPEKTEAPLIDLEGEPSLPTPQMAAMGISVKSADLDFDTFAQSRKSTVEPTDKEGSLLDQDMLLLDASKPSDFDEMERWLKENPSSNPRGAAATVSSSEFDEFLAERAAATTEVTPARGGQKNIEKENEKQLFSL